MDKSSSFCILLFDFFNFEPTKKDPLDKSSLMHRREKSPEKYGNFKFNWVLSYY